MSEEHRSKIDECEEIDRSGSFVLVRLNGFGTYWYVVLDYEHYKLKFRFNSELRTISIDCCVEYDDQNLGSLADYTSDIGVSLWKENQPGEVTVSDDGLLTVLPRQQTASHVELRIGWVLRVPLESVALIRRAINLTESALTIESDAKNLAEA